jgi:outer membrane protein OmpA-like peptidoglycan-associated protein
MLTIQNFQGTPNSLRSAKRNERLSAQNRRLRALARGAVWVFAGAVLVTANGCLATRSWVQDQMSPVSAKANNADAKADQALAGLQNLHLERKLVLNSANSPTFAFGSSDLTPSAKHEIDGFFDDLQESPAGAASERVFVIAGHTDNIGKEDYNYQLGQRRAEGVAGYVIGKERIDPMQVRVISYGASQPVASNSTSSGRRDNRRVEILVYQEKISTGS